MVLPWNDLWLNSHTGFAFYFFPQKDVQGESKCEIVGLLWKIEWGWACCFSLSADGTKRQYRTLGSKKRFFVWLWNQARPNGDQQQISFLHSCWIILCAVLLAIFRSNSWSVCLLRRRHNPGDLSLKPPHAGRTWHLQSHLFCHPAPSSPIANVKLPSISKEKLASLDTFILLSLESLQWNDLILPWDLFPLNVSIWVHVISFRREGQHPGSWRSSLQFVICFSFSLALGYPSLTGFFTTMLQPSVWSDFEVVFPVGDTGTLGKWAWQRRAGWFQWLMETMA